MRLHGCNLGLLLVAAPLRAQDGALRVLRHTLGDTASPANLVTVIFDRPVYGRLDARVDAARLFHIEPAVPGRVAWRDPITIRFVPDGPLTPGDSFTVTIDSAFEALDGGRLERPFSFTFRVPGPRLLARTFGGEYSGYPQELPLDGKVKLVYSAPVDLGFLRRGARLELAGCGAALRKIALRPVRERRVAEEDPYFFKSAGGVDRDTIADRFRRVVELEPADSLPEGCSGHLVLPTTDDDARHGREESFAVNTASSFRLVGFDCGGRPHCAFDYLRLRFSAEVQRADAMRHLRIEPSVPIDLDAGQEQSKDWTHGAKPVYYALTVSELPSTPPVTSDVQGLSVERWYERFDNGAPVTSIEEGDLVRVHLRVTVPSDREYVAVEDPLPAGLEVVDLSLGTSASLQPFATAESGQAMQDGDRDRDGPAWRSWLYGSWDDGCWSPWEHKAVHDDKVVYFARKLWKGSYTASYVARATTAGSFVRPPAHAEEMYNPAVQGRSDGGRFEVGRGIQ